jgi:hypothetical protein
MNLLKVVSNLDSQVGKFLKNNSLVVNVLLVVYTLLLKQTPTEYVSWVNHLASRVVVALLVAYLAHLEPVTAVLLTFAFVLTLHELKNRNAVVEVVNNLRNNNMPKVPESVNVSRLENDSNKLREPVVAEQVMTEQELDANNAANNAVANNVNVVVNQHNLPENVKMEMVEEGHPVNNTLTDNIQLGDPAHRQLDIVQNNVTGVDPDHPVSAFKVVNDAQGLSFVKGMDPNASKQSMF